ncbi:MAG: SRPBCC family protein [Planctomycetota bacterium]|jgi:uncharacterized membrane protein
MLKKIFIGLVVIILILVGVGFALPTDYEVSRYVVIDAKPSRIHDHVGDLKRWDDWMPWKEQDPSMEITYGKRTTGVGANQTWTGKDGQGEIVLTSSDKDRGIEYDMSFDQGKIKSKGSVLYEVVGKSTRVTWTMSGEWPTPVLGGYMALLMKPLIGSSFEKGLAKLKQTVEAS